ncbi:MULTISPECIES: hydrolase [Streptococcus]|uniref:hydrolase n=1 Tax=Streptococcus TaxID=1301 RepID=UPI0022853AFF|nr:MULTISPECIES: hydrolase [Streptococcus]MCY7022880.1 hydrolase [Streptococcus sanguinis]MDQ8692744.1 hydrolase [Streptococcus sp. IsoGale022]
MKSRKKKLLFFAILALSFLTACSSIVNRDGEKIWMSDTEMSELRKKEEKIALYIINHYEDVQKIEFDEFSKGNLWKGDSVSLIVNDTSYIPHVSLDSKDENYNINDNSHADSTELTFRLKKKEKVTNFKDAGETDVIYSGQNVWLTTEEKVKVRNQEEGLALFLLNHYENVEKIEFTKISRKPFGQAREATLVVNDKIKIYSYLDDSYDNYHLSYNPEKDGLKAKENQTNLQSLDSITVIYYTGK